MGDDGLASECAGLLSELAAFVNRGFSPYERDDFERGAAERVARLRAACDRRVVRYAEVMVDRAVGRISPIQAVEAVDTDEILSLGDWLSLRALVDCAKWSLGAAPAERHRGYRLRAYDIAVAHGDLAAQAVILVNWAHAELAEGKLDEAQRHFEIRYGPASLRGTPT